MNATTQGNKKNSPFDFKALLERIRANPRIIFMITAAAAISIVVALLFWMQGPVYRVLYSNISEQDGGAIVTQLSQMQVPYRFADHNGAIMIPEDQVYEVRLKLAQQGLPKGGSVGFELLDQEKFGISQFNEQVNFQRALEGELARTIETLGPVQSARIHLAIPKPSLFVREQKAPTASVTLTLQNGRTLDEGQVNAISYMIASAVSGLDAAHVTIVDQSGHLLSGSDTHNTQTTQLKYIREVEDDYQNRIQAILTPVVGSANVRTQVTAQVDFTQNEQTVEEYAPNTSPDKMSIRSRHVVHDEQGGKSSVGGVPGALSNLPPTAATAPITTSTPARGAKDSAPHPASQAVSQKLQPYSQSHDDITNYELDRTLKHITRNTGNVERLSVAVVINYLPGKAGEPAALTPAQMKQINDLVKEAMGYTASRGDSVNVVNTPFSQSDKDVVLPLWQQQDVIQLVLSVLRYLLVALVAWMLWRKAVWPFWVKHQEMLLQRLEMEKEARQAEATAQRQKKEHSELAKAQQRMDTELTTQQLREMADEAPQIIALVIRQWMNKEQKPS
ncbi:flagellar basal-body MS-ring/collar protein FliF [Escherichia sp. E2748]|uniref:flagellar basal-body MS-ring/collar protein FliF n=1 Tax=Escherichia sp. E2748 TaxID=2044460 RepID=UPI0010810DEC|nr:flagellar basal-body MS-ring/collar protein FliF [Escherichia sp. E2748]TGB97346.1 flagellar M-ring protein FliF [Escherichia sp. E2748]TLI80202.1 flagellar basal body M-ring protein FliF [Escherichia sp. E2748]